MICRHWPCMTAPNLVWQLFGLFDGFFVGRGRGGGRLVGRGFGRELPELQNTKEMIRNDIPFVSLMASIRWLPNLKIFQICKPFWIDNLKSQAVLTHSYHTGFEFPGCHLYEAWSKDHILDSRAPSEHLECWSGQDREHGQIHELGMKLKRKMEIKRQKTERQKESLKRIKMKDFCDVIPATISRLVPSFVPSVQYSPSSKCVSPSSG